MAIRNGHSERVKIDAIRKSFSNKVDIRFIFFYRSCRSNLRKCVLRKYEGFRCLNYRESSVEKDTIFLLSLFLSLSLYLDFLNPRLSGARDGDNSEPATILLSTAVESPWQEIFCLQPFPENALNVEKAESRALSRASRACVTAINTDTWTTDRPSQIPDMRLRRHSCFHRLSEIAKCQLLYHSNERLDISPNGKKRWTDPGLHCDFLIDRSERQRVDFWSVKE